LLVNCTLGENIRVVEPVNIYGASLGDNVQVGPFTEIQSDVTIGRGTKIQSHSFICSLVVIGEDCFIGHGVMFTNDLLRGGPAMGDKSKWATTRIGNRVSIGSNVTLLPVNVCDDVVIGAGSVVTKDLSLPGTYVGNPAKIISHNDF
jgi:acetyltransferase-like isoleucine patch superfamily enzyme